METFTEIQADKQVKRCRKTGWPMATVMRNKISGEFFIQSHSKDCDCGRCPTLQTNGYFE